MKLEEAIEEFKGCKGKSCADCGINDINITLSGTVRQLCIVLDALRIQLENPLTPEEAVRAVLGGKTLYSREGDKVRELSYADDYLSLDGKETNIRLTGWREEL